jgi:hypothetical protein
MSSPRYSPGPWSVPRYDAALINALLEGLQQMTELDKDGAYNT